MGPVVSAPISGTSGPALPNGQDAAFAFVLLYLRRTGSTMLKEWLSTHKAVRCLPSLFRTNFEWPSGAARYGGDMEWLRDNVADEWSDVNLRRTKPGALLGQIVKSSGDKRAVGFKYLLAADEFTERILGFRSALRKILLVRENSLAAYSSDKVANATGQRKARSGGTIRRAVVEFDPDEFRRFAEWRHQAYTHARECARRPWLEIEYSVARTPEGIAKVGRFLGLDPSGFGPQPTAKRNSDDILSRFSNPECAYAYLEQNGLLHWAKEN